MKANIAKGEVLWDTELFSISNLISSGQAPGPASSRPLMVGREEDLFQRTVLFYSCFKFFYFALLLLYLLNLTVTDFVIIGLSPIPF